MRKFLFSTALGLLFGTVMPQAPAELFVYASVHAAEPTIPDWITKSCCGPNDVHRLRPDQVEDMGDYYVVDGYHEPIRKQLHTGIPDPRIRPSQDGTYWIFYSDSAAGWQGGMYGSHPFYQNASQSMYCFFIPMDI